jgi:hypothetical protein
MPAAMNRVAAGTADADHTDPGPEFIDVRPDEIDTHATRSPATQRHTKAPTKHIIAQGDSAAPAKS